jgi:hypothetical protein
MTRTPGCQLSALCREGRGRGRVLVAAGDSRDSPTLLLCCGLAIPASAARAPSSARRSQTTQQHRPHSNTGHTDLHRLLSGARQGAGQPSSSQPRSEPGHVSCAAMSLPEANGLPHQPDEGPGADVVQASPGAAGLSLADLLSVGATESLWAASAGTALELALSTEQPTADDAAAAGPIHAVLPPDDAAGVYAPAEAPQQGRPRRTSQQQSDGEEPRASTRAGSQPPESGAAGAAAGEEGRPAKRARGGQASPVRLLRRRLRRLPFLA